MLQPRIGLCCKNFLKTERACSRGIYLRSQSKDLGNELDLSLNISFFGKVILHEIKVRMTDYSSIFCGQL